ncbi:hypothetical protein KR054_006101, partial [Drosophila jambulina]
FHPTLLSVPNAVRKIETFFDTKKAKSYESGSSRKTTLDKALISMIATDLQPFRIVEDAGFRNFVYCLDPQYTLPCRRTLNDVLLTNMCEDMEKKLVEILSKVRHCAVTTDGWTSRANDHYLTVTCHFLTDEFKIKSAVLSTSKLQSDLDQTSENIASSLLTVLTKWGVSNKVSAIVTDNAASMIKACTILEKRHMPCYAHTLNLIMQDTLQLSKIKPIIAKCKRIVGFFKSSSIAYAKLKSAQENDTAYGLTQEVPTRWNSCYKMVSRILKIKDAVFRVLLDTKKSPPPLTAEEVSVLYDLEQLFEPFDDATNRISGSSYATISLIIPISADLHHRLCNMIQSFKTLDGVETCNYILQQINTRLFPYEHRTVSKIATILDPRFKKEGFRSSFSADSAVENLQNEICSHPTNLNVYSDSENDPPTHESKEKSHFFAFMKNKLEKKIKTPKSDAIIVLRQYLERPHATPDISPLDYWKVCKIV